MCPCTAGKDVQPSRGLKSCSLPLVVCCFGDFFNRTISKNMYGFAMEFFCSIPRVRLVEGINLGMRRHLLTVGEIVSG
jgi:hypothetical protein